MSKNLTAKVNGEILPVLEVCEKMFTPGDGVYPDETLYVIATAKGSYLVPDTAFNVEASTLVVTGQAINWL